MLSPLRILNRVSSLIQFKVFFPGQDKASALIQRAKNNIRSLDYLSLSDLTLLTWEWAKTLPHDIDCVVMMPRQGILAGWAASLWLEKPLTTVEMLQQGKCWYTSKRPVQPVGNRILLVDDSVGSGRQMFPLKQRLIQQGFAVKTATPLAYSGVAPYIDHVGMTTKGDVALEPALGHWCFSGPLGSDIDGVLCEDPDRPPGVEWFLHARPFRIPLSKIRVIATARKECYRAVTEHWLDENQVDYEWLEMKQDGENDYDVKAKAIRGHDLAWFWESEPGLARKLNLRTGVKVFCLKNGFMYGAGGR